MRPALSYFKDASSFDGMDFSTTIKIPGSKTVQSVEYIFNFHAMDCFAKYDCTGQQLIDAGIVLINGERAALHLESAEAKSR